MVEKLSFFESAILNFFASLLLKLVTIYGVPMIFQNLYNYPDFQQKARGV